jgi:hypothetical protein
MSSTVAISGYKCSRGSIADVDNPWSQSWRVVRVKIVECTIDEVSTIGVHISPAQSLLDRKCLDKSACWSIRIQPKGVRSTRIIHAYPLRGIVNGGTASRAASLDELLIPDK